MSENILIRFGWSNVLLLLFLALKSDDEVASSQAREEIRAMAKQADAMNVAEEKLQALRQGKKPVLAVMFDENGNFTKLVSDDQRLAGLCYITVDQDIESLESDQCIRFDTGHESVEAYAKDHVIEVHPFPLQNAGEYPSTARLEGADIERDTYNGIVLFRPVSSAARQAMIDLPQEMLAHGGVYYMTPATAVEAEKLLQDMGFVIADDTIRITL